MGIEVNKSSSFLRKQFFVFFIILLIPLSFFLFFTWKKYEVGGIRIKKLPVLSTVSIPDFTLYTQTGETLTRADIKGKIVVADFFFSSCPGICPNMSGQMQRLQEFLKKNENLKASYQLLSFTVDPEHDSSKVLAEYAERYSADHKIWKFLTGSREIIYPLATNFFKLSVGEAEKPIDEQFVHSEKFVLLDKQGYIRGYYNGITDTTVNKLMGDVVYLDIDHEIIESKQKKEK